MSSFVAIQLTGARRRSPARCPAGHDGCDRTEPIAQFATLAVPRRPSTEPHRPLVSLPPLRRPLSITVDGFGRHFGAFLSSWVCTAFSGEEAAPRQQRKWRCIWTTVKIMFLNVTHRGSKKHCCTVVIRDFLKASVTTNNIPFLAYSWQSLAILSYRMSILQIHYKSGSTHYHQILLAHQHCQPSSLG